MRVLVINLYDRLLAFLAYGLLLAVLSMVLSGDVHIATDTPARVRIHIRDIEFDFIRWTLGATRLKVGHAGLNEQAYLSEEARSKVVRDFFALRRELEQVERDIASAYADPDTADPAAATASLSLREADLRQAMRLRQSLAESILQDQLSVILAEQGLVTAGQPIPPVAFSITPLPFALIVSPRDQIRQDANLDVDGGLTLEARVELELEIASDLDVSTLIVPLGGIGTYPTMVGQSSDLHWIVSVVAHEWIHNYLTLRPLGLKYLASSELRTMNETTAEMVGNDLGALLIARYYPEMAREASQFSNAMYRDQAPPVDQVPGFDFRAAMHLTRINVEALLAEGKVDEAEAYMEERRAFMWDHGYQIRRLNQAYFAFYGAYSAGGGGAAGADPVGSAVRLLRRRSPSIQQFVDTMAWFTSFGQLQEYLGLPRA